tara:strand:- start:251 stop:580 length:330 start_codon:yes stop_codon:yes gene_type:complete
MGITKTNLYTENQNQLAAMAKVLGHPARLAIIQYLLEANACINTDLVKELGLAQATISQHLRELKHLELISGTIEGASMSYCINPLKWEELSTRFNELFNQYPAINNCC